MAENRFIEHELGNMTAIYSVIEGTMQFTVVPSSRRKYVLEDKLTLKGQKFNAPDSAVQVHVFGDLVNRQYSAGQTMRNSASSFALKFKEQTKTTENGITKIVSVLEREDGQKAFHNVLYRDGEGFIEVYTVYENGSQKPVTLEMLSSFSIGSLSPFELNNTHESTEIYRMRSQWTHEAKLEKLSLNDLILEPSWMNYGARGERFGSVGSMPTKKFMPFIGYTDKKRKVTWAASLAYAGSWQLEFYLSQNSVNLSGGLADFEFGHWRKNLAVGESLETPHAFITAIVGDIDQAAQILTEEQLRGERPASEKDMPVLYNDYCCNWGNCRRDNVLPLVDKAEEFGLKYFVIDAGWFDVKFDENGVVLEPNKEYYPNGFEEVVNYIRSKGMVPGVWFEPESRHSDDSFDWDKLPVVRRDGLPVRNLERFFFDMTNEKLVESIREAVIGNLKKYNLGYTKIDYNENIGVGCDGAESLGEGLRKQVLASEAFYREMARELPDLVIEMCSSGGMRCEPSIIALGSMMSFSDIHETLDEPIVACDIQRVLHPSKSQVWATLHEGDDENRLLYVLACCFYGRLCLSGPIHKLDEKQTAFVKKAIALYNRVSPIIRCGRSYFIGKTGSQRALSGYKGSLRVAKDGNGALLVLHCFDNKHPLIKVENPAIKNMAVEECLLPEGVKVVKTDKGVLIDGLTQTTAAIVRFKSVDE